MRYQLEPKNYQSTTKHKYLISMFKTLNLCLALVALEASAAIVSDGLWTGNDWYDTKTEIGVRNGIPYSNDPKV